MQENLIFKKHQRIKSISQIQDKHKRYQSVFSKLWIKSKKRHKTTKFTTTKQKNKISRKKSKAYIKPIQVQSLYEETAKPY